MTTPLKTIAAAAVAGGITFGASAADTPTIVLVHGAVLDGSPWRAVHDLLVEDEFSVAVVQLPLTGLTDDVAAVREVLAFQDGPITLVGHSYGGAVISVAGTDPDVEALVYVAALQPDAGESVAELNASMPSPVREGDVLFTEGGDRLYVNPDRFAQAVAADLPPADARFLAHSQTPTALSAFTTPLPEVAWHDKPIYAVVAAQDQNVSPSLQRWMYKRSGAEVTELDASHMVQMSHPEAVADVIEVAAKGAAEAAQGIGAASALPSSE